MLQLEFDFPFILKEKILPNLMGNNISCSEWTFAKYQQHNSQLKQNNI
jgi:hypothetical protein